MRTSRDALEDFTPLMMRMQGTLYNRQALVPYLMDRSDSVEEVCSWRQMYRRHF